MKPSIIITSSNDVMQYKFYLGWVFVPQFEIYKSPTFTIEEILLRRYSLLDRYK
jgi:hypothetical protein